MAFSGAISSGRRIDWLGKWAALVVVAAIFGASSLVVAHLGILQARTYYAEGGAIELSQAVLLVVVAFLYLAWRHALGARSLVPWLLLSLMAVRELDGDKWFTAKSIASTGYYLDNPGVPYGERVFFGAIMLALGITILRFLWSVRRQILRALREAQPYCHSILVGLAMIALSLMMDGLRGKVSALTGVHLSEMTGYLSGIGEETAEFGMALAFLVGLLQLRFDPARNRLPAG